ncbi:MAG: hypothetical protein EHM41_05585 [Chloroflexi bacterium]|nr:MAG: hypothetical protein EHM41_05585 [Chloroflexota bacterium]
MKRSIVIVKDDESDKQEVGHVLVVKHPEGSDPVEQLRAAISDFLKDQVGKQVLRDDKEVTWSEALQWMDDWDWSGSSIYVEDARSFAVVDPDESFKISNPNS